MYSEDIMDTSISNVLNKRMTRVEFIKYLGVISISVFGISSFLKNLSALDPKKPVSSGKRTFGSGAYGV